MATHGQAVAKESRHLWVGGLPDDVDESKIKEYFSRYGKVEGVKILPQKYPKIGVAAFVDFYNLKSAIEAKESKNKLNGHELRTNFKTKQSEKYGETGSKKASEEEKQAVDNESNSSSSDSGDDEGSNSSSDSHSDAKNKEFTMLRITSLPSKPERVLQDGLYYEYTRYSQSVEIRMYGEDSEKWAVAKFKKPEKCKKALEKTQGLVLFGSKLSVTPMSSDDFPSGGRSETSFPFGGNRPAKSEDIDPAATRSLFVGNIPKNIDVYEVRDIFQRYGNILDVEIKKMGGTATYGFVLYYALSSAIAAKRFMDGQNIKGNNIRVGYGKGTVSKQLWIDGVDPDMSRQQLEKHMSKYGKVVRLGTDNQRHCAMVQYDTIDSARKALESIKGTHIGNSKKLMADFANRDARAAFFSQIDMEVPSHSFHSGPSMYGGMMDPGYRPGVMMPPMMGMGRGYHPQGHPMDFMYDPYMEGGMGYYGGPRPPFHLGRGNPARMGIPPYRGGPPFEDDYEQELAAYKRKKDWEKEKDKKKSRRKNWSSSSEESDSDDSAQKKKRREKHKKPSSKKQKQKSKKSEDESSDSSSSSDERSKTRQKSTLKSKEHRSKHKKGPSKKPSPSESDSDKKLKRVAKGSSSPEEDNAIKEDTKAKKRRVDTKDSPVIISAGVSESLSPKPASCTTPSDSPPSPGERYSPQSKGSEIVSPRLPLSDDGTHTRLSSASSLDHVNPPKPVESDEIDPGTPKSPPAKKVQVESDWSSGEELKDLPVESKSRSTSGSKIKIEPRPKPSHAPYAKQSHRRQHYDSDSGIPGEYEVRNPYPAGSHSKHFSRRYQADPKSPEFQKRRSYQVRDSHSEGRHRQTGPISPSPPPGGYRPHSRKSTGHVEQIERSRHHPRSHNHSPPPRGHHGSPPRTYHKHSRNQGSKFLSSGSTKSPSPRLKSPPFRVKESHGARYRSPPDPVLSSRHSRRHSPVHKHHNLSPTPGRKRRYRTPSPSPVRRSPARSHKREKSPRIDSSHGSPRHTEKQLVSKEAQSPVKRRKLEGTQQRPPPENHSEEKAFQPSKKKNNSTLQTEQSTQLPPSDQPQPGTDNLLDLLRRYPVIWQGHLTLKNDSAAVQLHFLNGNVQLAKLSLPQSIEKQTPSLRIAQRMRLEKSQLDGVGQKMLNESDHCLLLALPCGRDASDVHVQTNALKHTFINYLIQKQAAGIINISHPSSESGYVLHIFPPCQFSQQHLSRVAPDLLTSASDNCHLMIVVAM